MNSLTSLLHLFYLCQYTNKRQQQLHILPTHNAFVLNLHNINLKLLRETFRNKSTGKQSVWTRNRQVNIMILHYLTAFCNFTFILLCSWLSSAFASSCDALVFCSGTTSGDSPMSCFTSSFCFPTSL